MMIRRILVASLGIVLVLCLVGIGQAQRARSKKAQPRGDQSSSNAAAEADKPTDADQGKDKDKESGKDKAGDTSDKTSTSKETSKKVAKLEKATFGGGCFWCTEAVFERVPGVKSVVSGYSGGTVPYPTYEQVSSGLTGHAEVIQIQFDPSVVSYDKLLKIFFSSHDPTTLNSQGPDFGTQYRSIILFHSDEQKVAAQKMYKELMAQRGRRSPIVTELVPFVEFYPAEAYHQDYYRNHPDADYSQIYIEPKVRKLRQKLKAEAASHAP
jgi:peptide-methionine (S)-S-oxide reductase